MKILIYIMPLLLIVYLICITVDISKRNKGMKAAEKAGGVSFRHKYPEFVKALWLLSLGIFLKETNALLKLFGRDEADLTLKKMGLIFSTTILFIDMIYGLIVYIRYNEFRLCANCFYFGGAKYDRKKYTYSLDGEEVVFRSGRTEKRITVPEKKRKEVLGILGKYYTKSENG